MKKVTFFAAAVAMLALASCNKEESGMASLSMTKEAATSDDKQAYGNDRIFFTTGEDIIVNGVTYQLNASANRRNATTFVHANSEGYKVNYGNVYMDGNQVKANFRSEVDMVPNLLENVEIVAENNPWAMSAFVADAGQTFTLLHNVAYIAPTVKYGNEFINFMWGDNGKDQAYAGQVDANTTPTLVLDKFVLTSSDMQFSGTATLGQSIYGEEIFIMDAAAQGENTLTVNADAPVQYSLPGDQSTSYRLGAVPVCPMYYMPGVGLEAKHVNVVFYFTATIKVGGVDVARHFTYSGSFVTSQNLQFKRGRYLDFKCNLFNLGANTSAGTQGWNDKVVVYETI